MNGYTIKIVDDLYVNPAVFLALKALPAGAVEYHTFYGEPQTIAGGALADAYTLAVREIGIELVTVIVNALSFTEIAFNAALGVAEIVYPHGVRVRLTGAADVAALRTWCENHQFATAVVVEFDGA
jgi:hypothetical protein